MRAKIPLVGLCLLCLAAGPRVTLMRCPDQGVQPQAAVDDHGRIHLIYLKGPDGASGVYYVRSDDGAKTWTTPIRVNSHEGSAIATGTVRGAQLALGRGGQWIHVSWMGSDKARPRAPKDSSPMMYARMKAGAAAFETERNLITAHPGLDGGGSVAADDAGNVYVAWHAPGAEKKGEAGRMLYLARSSDDGKTFQPEREFMAAKTGVCGCCGMRLGIDPHGQPVALYRAANERTRDIYLAGADKARLLSEWAIKTCPMSTATFAQTDGTLLAAWEAAQQVWLGRADGGKTVSPPGDGNNRKHPSVAAGNDGSILLAWTEGTGWKRGGSVAWQVFNRDLQPVAGAGGMQNDLAAWSLPSAVWMEGGFVVIY